MGSTDLCVQKELEKDEEDITHLCIYIYVCKYNATFVVCTNAGSYEECQGKLRLESGGGKYSWSIYVDINAPNGATTPRHSPFNPVFNVGQDGPTRQ